MRHNYLKVTDKKPTVAEIEIGELAINLSDKIIYTKTPEGVVIALDGSA